MTDNNSDSIGARPEPIDLEAHGIGPFQLSDEAMADIRAIERRQQRVITTSHLYTFGASK